MEKTIYAKVTAVLITANAILFSFNSFSQGAAINASGSNAHPSAMLEVSSDNAGILIPRMTEFDKNAIVSPATGLMIYQTDGLTGFWYYDGNGWIQSIGVAGAVGPTGADGVTGPIGPTGFTASCPPANTGETLINYNGCMYVKNVDESGTYIWVNALAKCTSLGTGWYLPNIEELKELYLNWNQPVNGGTCQGGACLLSGFNTSYYWSSTVANASFAWSQDFSNLYQDSYKIKTNTYYVRCVRR